MIRLDPEDRLLTPAEVAARFRVDPKTVTRWARAGKISAIRTLGGHRRYRESEVESLLQDGIEVATMGPASVLASAGAAAGEPLGEVVEE